MPVILLLAVFSVFINLFRLTIPLYLIQVVDRVVSSESMETLLYITLIAAGALISSAFLTGATVYIQSRVGDWFEEKLFNPVSKASILGRLTGQSNGASGIRDLAQLRGFLSSPTISTLFEVPWTPIFLGIIFLLHPLLGTVAAVVSVIMLILAVVNDLATSGPQLSSQQAQGQIGRGVEQAADSAAMINAMGMLNKLVLALKKIRDTGALSQDKFNERSGLINGMTRLVRSMAQVAILGTGAYLILNKEITTGTMIAASILQSLGLSPVEKAMGAIRAVKGATKAYTRLNRQLSAVNTSESLLRMDQHSGYSVSLNQAMYMIQGMGKPILRPMSFDIKPGEMVGILGASGAGKSTLCQVLVGSLKPSSGGVQVGGFEISQIAGEEFGAHVGYVTQTQTFINGTIAENIARFSDGRKDERDAAIIDAAKMVGVHDVILGLPERYETPLSAQGTVLLSKSQLQKVILARAVFGEPRLLVLDEPTLHLDKIGVSTFSKALSALRSAGTTIVAVSQHANFVTSCDKLLFMKEGMVLSFGEPLTVLEQISNGGARPQTRLISGSNPSGATG